MTRTILRDLRNHAADRLTNAAVAFLENTKVIDLPRKEARAELTTVFITSLCALLIHSVEPCKIELVMAEFFGEFLLTFPELVAQALRTANQPQSAEFTAVMTMLQQFKGV